MHDANNDAGGCDGIDNGVLSINIGEISDQHPVVNKNTGKTRVQEQNPPSSNTQNSSPSKDPDTHPAENVNLLDK